MDHETDASVLTHYSDEQWNALLEVTWSIRGVRKLVVVPEGPPRIVRAPALGSRGDLRPQIEDRRLYIARRVSEGVTRSAIAIELGVSAGLITRILNGTRS